MNTIIVVYSNAESLTDAQISKPSLNKWAFNTKAKLKKGDVLFSHDYTSNMHVIKVLDRSYKYYNPITGELSDEFESTKQWNIEEKQWNIEEIVLREEDSEIVYASLVNKN